jgi:hypothetical protein
MAERINELVELHPDKALALRIERGEVSQEEVNHVWAETRDLSAQTPFETRRAIVELRKCGSLNDAWPVFFTHMTEQMSQMAGAMTRDDSKFAHLVAGTETVVRELQKVGPLAANLTDLKRQMQYLTDEVRQLRAERTQAKKSWWRKLFTKREVAVSEDAQATVDVEPMDYERDAERARKETIGSAWAK